MDEIRLMLDTTAVSAFFKGHEEIGQYISSADELYISPVVIGELLAGFIMGKREQGNRELLDEFLSSPRVRVTDIDRETSERYAAIFGHLKKSGTPIPTNDLWIAASAMQHGLKLLATDRHYLKVPQIITTFFEPITS
jgi:tRNA(fMet)-specific endonuclease VapC